MTTDDDSVAAQVSRRGAVPLAHLVRLGMVDDSRTDPPAGVRVVGEWWVDEDTHAAWSQRLRRFVLAVHDRDPLAEGLSMAGVPGSLGLPDPAVLPGIIADAGLAFRDGFLSVSGHHPDLGDAEEAIAALERRLRDQPYRAPEADDLQALGLGSKELAAAARMHRILRLRDGVILLPTAPALAMRTLATLPQPFTTSTARQSLGTTRRVVIPLLEHLDSRGWTRRLDAGHREVVR
jgi:selenocysteine-specific elongation factor